MTPIASQHSAVDHAAAVADFLVAGVENQVGDSSQRPVAPSRQFFVEQFGGPADLRTGDLVPQSSWVMAATLRVETPWTYISARASFKARSLRSPRSRADRIELDAAGLGDAECHCPQRV